LEEEEEEEEILFPKYYLPVSVLVFQLPFKIPPHRFLMYIVLSHPSYLMSPSLHI
jgi:hypothetical protein